MMIFFVLFLLYMNNPDLFETLDYELNDDDDDKSGVRADKNNKKTI